MLVCVLTESFNVTANRELPCGHPLSYGAQVGQAELETGDRKMEEGKWREEKDLQPSFFLPKP
jgi:hypothetical protein